MAVFEKGQTFLDKKALDFSGVSPKYFIALSNADYPDDKVICFVMNSENEMDKYHFNCNRDKFRFIIKKNTFSFINRPTSIMLIKEVIYTFEEICQSNIKLLDVANDLLTRQIKNCIDWNFLLPKSKELIINSFKS